MPQKKATLSANEWRMMETLWASEKPMAMAEIVEAMKDTVTWGYPTFQTQLKRRIKSGYVGFERHDRIRLFYPLANMDQCVREEKVSIRGRMSPQASNQLLVSMLRDAEGIGDEEVWELKTLINEWKRKYGDA